jgi:ribonucleoside-diphosphate reductase beta chain
MARNGKQSGNAQAALRRMTEADPDLAARLVVHSLPAAAAPLPSEMRWRLDVDGIGSWFVQGGGGERAASLTPASNGEAGEADFTLSTDSAGLAELASGAGPLGLLARRRIRLKGKRRRAFALRRMSADAGPRDLARLGAPVDMDLVYRALAHAIDPDWARGRSFAIAYEVSGKGGGRWLVEVDDGKVRVSSGANGRSPDATVTTDADTWMALLRGDVSPSTAMQQQRTKVEGELYPVTLMGRWIDRADGRDEPELERERRQAEVQRSRAGAWGSSVNGSANGAPGAIDPAQKRGPARGGGLMTYEQLYALWEKRNWRVHELDFSVDRDHWLATPEEGQKHTAFSMGSFFVGEERVAADLAPFLLAAPSGEIEAFLATQLVDEARHAVFFDRWAAEVMALSADDLRGRLQEMERPLLAPWHFLFDEELRGVANRLVSSPDDLELFVEGIVIYHMVTEGVLAMTGQRAILDYTGGHSIFPGFQKGFSLVEQDEHRHIAFGVRFLRDVCRERPEMKKVVLSTLERLLPEAAKVFAPPEADDTSRFVSYAYTSEQIYGFAYTALKRRMDVVGVEIPGPERLMPGPIDPAGFEGGLSSAPAAVAG